MWFIARHPWVALFALGLVFVATPSEAVVIERVVAVVGDRPVLLTELQARARPLLMRVYAQSRNASERAAGVSEIYRHTLDSMIDEMLEQKVANQADIAVTRADVDRMLEVVAAQNRLTVDQLLREAEKSGLSSAAYREELKRQTLTLRLQEWRFQGRIRTTEQDLKAAYNQAVQHAEQQRPIRLAWIVINTGRGSREDPKKAALVRELQTILAQGSDFAELAKEHSEDEKSAPIGGLLPDTTVDQLPHALQQAVAKLQVGGISGPVRLGNDTVLVKLVERAPLEVPSFEQARPGLEQQVRARKMSEARAQWLRTLRSRTHVDVRL